MSVFLLGTTASTNVSNENIFLKEDILGNRVNALDELWNGKNQSTSETESGTLTGNGHYVYLGREIRCINELEFDSYCEYEYTDTHNI